MSSGQSDYKSHTVQKLMEKEKNSSEVRVNLNKTKEAYHVARVRYKAQRICCHAVEKLNEHKSKVEREKYQHVTRVALLPRTHKKLMSMRAYTESRRRESGRKERLCHQCWQHHWVFG